MKINCLSCGHNIDLDDAYGDHYEGEIKCFGCGSSLELRTEQQAVRWVRIAGSPTAAIAGAEAIRSQGTAGEAVKPRSYKARNEAKQGSVELRKSGSQHASPSNTRVA